MSKYLASISTGTKIEMLGPRGSFGYLGSGLFTGERRVKRVGMVAAGSGITPMLQMLRKLLGDTGEHLPVTLILCNRTKDNIIAKDELERAETRHAARFRCHHVFSENQDRLSEEMMKNVLPKVRNDAHPLK